MTDLEKIISQAQQELAAEEFRRAVDAYKIKLKNKKSLWDKIFPWKLVIIRKGEIK